MAAQPPFALHPADAIPGVIDLTTREGIKLGNHKDPNG